MECAAGKVSEMENRGQLIPPVADGFLLSLCKLV